MTDLATANFFRDRAVQDDPYPYFDAVRAASPVWQEPHYGVLHGDRPRRGHVGLQRLGALLVVQRGERPVRARSPSRSRATTSPTSSSATATMLPFSDQLPSFDPPHHTAHRALDDAAAHPGPAPGQRGVHGGPRGSPARAARRARAVRVHRPTTPQPFTLLVVADLEGVPESDHDLFRERLSASCPGSSSTSRSSSSTSSSPPTSRTAAANPRDDIMTAMATATFPDGIDARGQRRRAARRQPLHRRPGDHGPPALVRAADHRRAARHPGARCARTASCIPNFIEETLRYESPLRAQFRMAKVRTTVAGVDIPAGTTMLLLPGAANRDPRQFADPDVFDLDRANARYHVAFGHGIHHCAGAHLARAEGRVTINRLLDHTVGHHDLRGGARPGRRPPLRVPARRTSSAASQRLDLELTRPDPRWGRLRRRRGRRRRASA